MESFGKPYSGRCPGTDRTAHFRDPSPLARVRGQWQ